MKNILLWLSMFGICGAASKTTPSPSPTPNVLLERATFAGGCFWCMESPFADQPGVVSITVGYTGGTKVKPTYEEVSSGTTGHAESVDIIFDPKVISYQKLVDIFWHQIDPVARDAQFCDHGHQYRSAIFYYNPEQKKIAEDAKAALEKSGRFKPKIWTEITPAGMFYPAEDYHQHYYKENPIRYHYYRSRCGRDERLKEVWGKS